MDALLLRDFRPITNFYILDAVIQGNWPALKSLVLHLVMPSVTLGLILMGPFIRLTRVNMIEALKQTTSRQGGHVACPRSDWLTVTHSATRSFPF